MKRQLVRLLLLVTSLLIADQLILFTALADGRFLGRWIAPFDPPLFTEWQFNRRADIAAIVEGDDELRGQSLFDPDLGWCPASLQTIGLYEYDWAGSRISHRPLAREKRPDVRRVVAVGGSFTAGAEVHANETWLAQAEEGRDDLEVANLGIAGYGPDQGYLRYKRDGRPLDPDEVWLGYMPGATLRITTQFPPVFRHWSSVVAFKPRFALDEDGALRLFASPAKDFRDFTRLLGNQDDFVASMGHDLWVRRTPAAFAPHGSSWIHRSAVGRLAITWLEAGDRNPAVWLADPASEVRRLFAAIIAAFDAEVRATGASFRLLVLPSRPDLAVCAAGARPYWSALLADLAANGVDSFDATPALLAAGAQDDDTSWMPHGHYSPRANRIVAAALLEHLAR